MKVRQTRWLAVIGMVLVAAAPAGAQVTVSNVHGAPHELSLSSLAAMPSETAIVDGKGGRSRYAGPRLWAVLVQSATVDADMHDRVHEVVVVTGSDGYAVPLALAELDPEFEGKGVLLATTHDGQALAKPRLIVPGDKQQGRDVRDVTTIGIRSDTH